MVFLLMLSGCTAKAYLPYEGDKALKIVVTNDLHYAHPSMIGNHQRSQSLSEKADGKVIPYLSEITESFVLQMMEEKPEVIILNGDLVFNGEKENHKHLSQLLQKLESLVLVTPGNHDIDSQDAIKITETQSYSAQSVSETEFLKFYENYGYRQARSMDQNSLSYVVEVSDSLDIFMMDSRCDASCDNLHGGYFKANTLQWLENQLQASASRNAEILFVSHHNTLIHHEGLNEGFTIDNSDELLSLLKKYDVKLSLSGHIHVQSIQEENEIVDIATQALSIYSIQYGVVAYTPSTSFDYSTQKVDVSKYFEEIPQFESMAYNTMHYANYRRTAFKLLDDGSISDEDDLLSIAELDAQIKAYYFSGQLIHHKEAIAKSATFTKMFEKYPFEMRKLQNAIDIFGQKDHQKIKVDI